VVKEAEPSRGVKKKMGNKNSGGGVRGASRKKPSAGKETLH